MFTKLFHTQSQEHNWGRITDIIDWLQSKDQVVMLTILGREHRYYTLILAEIIHRQKEQQANKIKLLIIYIWRNENLDALILNFLSPMNIWKTKQPYLSIFGVWKIKVWPLRFNGPYWKSWILQNALIVDVICA